MPSLGTQTLSAEQRFVAELRSRLSRDFNASNALTFATNHTGGDFFIFGGTLRRVLLGAPAGGDLDLILPNHDERLHDAFNKLGLPVVLNSNQHRRYTWSDLEIDALSPREFGSGFTDACSMLSTVDLKINSLGFHIGTEHIVDPYSILKTGFPRSPGLIWNSWETASPERLQILSIKLSRLLFNHPQLALTADESAFISQRVVPLISDLPWRPVLARFPAGSEVFLNLLRGLIQGKQSP